MQSKVFRTRFMALMSKFAGISTIHAAVLWGSLVRSNDGAFWTLGSGGIYRFDGSRWDTHATLVDPKSILTKAYPTKLGIDADGVLWYGTSNGLIRFDGHSWNNWREPDGPNG